MISFPSPFANEPPEPFVPSNVSFSIPLNFPQKLLQSFISEITNFSHQFSPANRWSTQQCLHKNTRNLCIHKNQLALCIYNNSKISFSKVFDGKKEKRRKNFADCNNNIEKNKFNVSSSLACARFVNESRMCVDEICANLFIVKIVFDFVECPKKRV